MSAGLSGEWIDKLAIRELLERYMRYNDDGDLDQILGLFEPDGAYQVMGRVLVGRDEIAGFLEERGFERGRRSWHEPGELLLQTRSAHLSSNPVIELSGDTAYVESDFLVVRRGADGRAKAALAGRYRDELRKADGCWRIYTRTAVSVARPGEERSDNEWQAALARSPQREQQQLRT